MKLAIKEKDKYQGLIETENKRIRRDLIKALSLNLIGSLLVVIVIMLGAVVIASIVKKLEALLINSINLDINYIICMLLAVMGVLICAGVWESVKGKKANDEFLKKLYKYLPLDRDDINKNGLVNYLDYLICIHKLIKEINKESEQVTIHERVRHDIIDIIRDVYVVDRNILDIINTNFETIVFKCNTESKIKRLIKYYLQEEELFCEYDNMQEELGI